MAEWYTASLKHPSSNKSSKNSCLRKNLDIRCNPWYKVSMKFANRFITAFLAFGLCLAPLRFCMAEKPCCQLMKTQSKCPAHKSVSKKKCCGDKDCKFTKKQSNDPALLPAKSTKPSSSHQSFLWAPLQQSNPTVQTFNTRHEIPPILTSYAKIIHSSRSPPQIA